MTSAAASGPDLPGTSTSPFDPSPDLNPFSSTVVFAGAPTWAALASADDGRARALALGRQHGALMQSLEQLSAANGGGLLGLTKGMLGRLEAQHLVTQGDRERLMAIFTHLRDNSGRNSDQEAALSRLRVLHQAIVDEPTSSPLALATSAVALDSVTRALSVDSPKHAAAWDAGFADAVGMGVGGFGGPLVALQTACIASEVAEHTHVSVTFA